MKYWDLFEPGFKGSIHRITGLTDNGKAMLFTMIKNMKEDIITGENEEDIAEKVFAKFFDTRHCYNCIHKKICPSVEIIRKMQRDGIEVNSRCDNWLSEKLAENI
jgi:hypothetical protein